VASLLLCAFLLVQLRVHSAASGRAYQSAGEVPSRQVAVVFGASVRGKLLSVTLEKRVESAVRLHRLGRVERILVSGDNSSTYYNESDAMRRHVLSLGVPEEDVVSDFAGFSTYETLYRARELFGVRRPVLVTQGYHLPRALYIARGLGLDAVGLEAGSAGGAQPGPMFLRELLASVKAFVQVEITQPLPTYLGPEEVDLEKGGQEPAPTPAEERGPAPGPSRAPER
jgi:vancomycin permeability regulator SanA